MKQLFKTTLLAATIAATCGSAVAGTVAVTKQVHSMEGLAGVTANQTSNAISYTVAAAYAVGDKITFTFPEGALVATSFPSQINVPAENSATEASAIAGMGLGLLDSDTKSVTYRVTSLSQPNNAAASNPVDYTSRTTIGAVVPLGAVGYKASAVAAASVTVTVSSVTSSGDNLDTSGTRTATVAETKTQFGSATINTKFDGVINVSEMRKKFVSGSSDSMSFTITNPSTTGWLNVATVNTSGATLFGEPGKMTDLKKEYFNGSGTETFDAAAAKLSVAYTNMVTNDTITFTPPTGDKAVVLEAQAFTTDLVYNYTSAGSTAGSKTIATGLASGEWKLNGATVNIPYMPYSTNASQIMYVSNEGSQAGDIIATAFDDKGNVYELGTIAVANGKTVTKISKQVGDALLAKGFSAGKVSITITVNAPAADITVYASYNVGGSDRGYVNTDQYKGK
jgi:hypothetical protein